MKKNLLALLLLLMAGTAMAQTSMKRFKKLREGKTDNNLVSIEIFSATVASSETPTGGKTVFDLSERGQAASLDGKNNNDISELLNKKFQSDSKNKMPVVDMTTRNITVTFSIGRKPSYAAGNFSAYDRIEDLNYSFKMDNHPAVNQEVRFARWNKYVTEYGTLDIGSLEFNQGFTANLDVTGKIGASASTKSVVKDGDNTTETGASVGPEVSATGKVGYNRSRKENQLIKQRFIQLTGTFGERQFSIHQQGTRETELAGNVSVDVTIKFPPAEVIFTNFSDLYTDKNAINGPDKVKMEHTRYKVPDITMLATGLTGQLSYSFAVRHIHKKANTFPESDDRISFITGENSKAILLVKPEELKVPIYFIHVPVGGNMKTLQYDDAGIKRAISFTSYSAAAEFRSWLIYTIPSLGANGMKIMNKDISFEGTPVSNAEVTADFSQITVQVQ